MADLQAWAQIEYNRRAGGTELDVRKLLRDELTKRVGPGSQGAARPADLRAAIAAILAEWPAPPPVTLDHGWLILAGDDVRVATDDLLRAYLAGSGTLIPESDPDAYAYFWGHASTGAIHTCLSGESFAPNWARAPSKTDGPELDANGIYSPLSARALPSAALDPTVFSLGAAALIQARLGGASIASALHPDWIEELSTARQWLGWTISPDGEPWICRLTDSGLWAVPADVPNELKCHSAWHAARAFSGLDARANLAAVLSHCAYRSGFEPLELLDNSDMADVWEPGAEPATALGHYWHWDAMGAGARIVTHRKIVDGDDQWFEARYFDISFSWADGEPSATISELERTEWYPAHLKYPVWSYGEANNEANNILIYSSGGDPGGLSGATPTIYVCAQPGGGYESWQYMGATHVIDYSVNPSRTIAVCGIGSDALIWGSNGLSTYTGGFTSSNGADYTAPIVIATGSVKNRSLTTSAGRTKYTCYSRSDGTCFPPGCGEQSSFWLDFSTSQADSWACVDEGETFAAEYNALPDGGGWTRALQYIEIRQLVTSEVFTTDTINGADGGIAFIVGPSPDAVIVASGGYTIANGRNIKTRDREWDVTNCLASPTQVFGSSQYSGCFGARNYYFTGYFESGQDPQIDCVIGGWHWRRVTEVSSAYAWNTNTNISYGGENHSSATLHVGGTAIDLGGAWTDWDEYVIGSPALAELSAPIVVRPTAGGAAIYQAAPGGDLVYPAGLADGALAPVGAT